MSRRDTIIIALLVNAGLLALLFMLAINTNEENIVDQPEITKTIVDNRSTPSPARPTTALLTPESNVNDEVDSFLKDLAAGENSQHLLIDEYGYIEIQAEAPAVITKNTKKEPKTESKTELGNFVEVTVKRGDALEKIARSNGTTVEAIKKANSLSNAKLSIGQVLKVPVSNKTEEVISKPVPAIVASAPPKTNPLITASTTPKEIVKKPIVTSDVQYYTIKSGDNPWKIAKQYNVKFDDLLRLNNLDEERARNLKIGDKVRVK